jgi:hypothetical protein
MGIRLPPEKYCLTAPTYQINPKATLEAWKKKGTMGGLTKSESKNAISIKEPSSSSSETVIATTQITTSNNKLSSSSASTKLEERPLASKNKDDDYDME